MESTPDTRFDTSDPECPYDEEYLRAEASSLDRSTIRAEREDDDGYDPYSDRVEYAPLFEKDPWN